MAEQQPEIGQRWRWSKPDKFGQRLTVEVVTILPYITAEIIQVAMPDSDLVIGKRFTMSLGSWELLSGQDRSK